MDKLKYIRAIAFDLDGTLVDSSPGLTQAIDMTLYALELPAAGEEKVEQWIGNGADVLIQRALCWALKGEEPNAQQQRMARKLFDCFYAQTAREGSFLFPDVKQSLQVLFDNKFAIGLVTNKPTPFVRPLLDELGIAHYFQVIIGGDDVVQKKPHPEPLLSVMEKLSIHAEQLLFVGDSRNDIQAARAAGCPCVGLTYGYNYGEAISLSHPDYTFDKFAALLPALGLPSKKNQEAE